MDPGPMSEPTLAGALPIVVGLVAIGPPDDARYVVTRRHASAHLGGQWELPGGKLHAGESPEQALERELAEELGVVVASATPITFSWYTYPERTVLLLFFDVRLRADSPAPRPLEASELRLVTREALLDMPFPAANAPLLAALARTR